MLETHSPECLGNLGGRQAAGEIFDDTELRIGVIGLDNSHAVEFAKLLNDKEEPNWVSGGKIVGAFPGGSIDIELSLSRTKEFSRKMAERYSVKIYNSIEKLIDDVDAVLILSIDGRVHYEQARAVFGHGKPAFIDKPLAANLRDVIKIVQLGRMTSTPWFSSSALRFCPRFTAMGGTEIGMLRGAIAWGPLKCEPHHPDLFWYGIHTVEALYAALGSGCISVECTHTTQTDVITGIWRGKRFGTMVGIRDPSANFFLTAFGQKGHTQSKGFEYPPLLEEIIKFFNTQIPPVPAEETVEIFAFMEASHESRRRGGRPVSIDEILSCV